MKKLVCIIAILISFSMIAQQKTKVIFFGDSITELAVHKGGYIDRIQTMINDHSLQQQFELLGAGISGNKIYDLYLRLEDDVLNKKPDVVLIWVGVNDVWHKTWGTGTDLNKFEKFYEALIKKMQAQNIKLILLTPAVIGEKHDGTNLLDKELDAYSEVIRKLSKAFGCSLVDSRKIFMDYEKLHNTQNAESGILTRDKVHLNEKGNQLIAEAIWEKLK